MAGFARVKRVTPPLDDQAKARLVCCHQLSYNSSGSEHNSDAEESPCLYELVHGFLEEECDKGNQSPSDECDSDRVYSAYNYTDSFNEIMRLKATNSTDRYRNVLIAHVVKGVKSFSCFDQKTRRHKVMVYLRELGHDAAICKTKWDSSCNLTGGNHEFIDVIFLRSRIDTCATRYIVDLDFTSQFEIAKPTSEYLNLLQALPKVFVGKIEELKRIVKVICDAARRSLKIRELTLPPWRKSRFMLNKWLSTPYQRSINPFPDGYSSVNGVKCRLIGFDVGVNGRLSAALCNCNNISKN